MNFYKIDFLVLHLLISCDEVKNDNQEVNIKETLKWDELVDANLSKWDKFLSYQHQVGYDGSQPKDEQGNLIPPIGLNNPDYEVEVTYEGTINDNSDIDKGWTMELAIPISDFGELGQVEPIKSGAHWAFLAIRQDRNDSESDRRSTSTIFPIYDISKNVHQANRFGLVEFVD